MGIFGKHYKAGHFFFPYFFSLFSFSILFLPPESQVTSTPLHVPKVLPGEHYSRPELLQVAGRKAWCRSFLSPAQISCRRGEQNIDAQDQRMNAVCVSISYPHLLSPSFFPILPFGISFWDYKKRYAQWGTDIPPHSKMHPERLGEASVKDLMLSTRLTLPSLCFTAFVSKSPMRK